MVSQSGPYVDDARLVWSADSQRVADFSEDRAGQITTGDENFAVVLKQQSPEFREQIRERFSDDITTQPISKPKPYIKRYFPKSYQLPFGP